MFVLNIKGFLVILGVDPVLDANARKCPQNDHKKDAKRPQIKHTNTQNA